MKLGWIFFSFTRGHHNGLWTTAEHSRDLPDSFYARLVLKIWFLVLVIFGVETIKFWSIFFHGGIDPPFLIVFRNGWKPHDFLPGGKMVGGLPPAFSCWMCRRWVYSQLYASWLGFRLCVCVFVQLCRGQHWRVWVLENWALYICVSSARVRSRDL